MQTRLFRQGDILFARIQKLPRGEARKHQDGIVAHGEVTGHTHAIADPGAAELLEIEDGLFVKVSAEGGVSIVHQEHKPIELPRGNYRVIRQREYSPEEIRNVAD